MLLDKKTLRDLTQVLHYAIGQDTRGSCPPPYPHWHTEEDSVDL